MGRGGEASYCILLGDVSPEAWERLRIFCATDDGFEIARADLRLRGMGDLFGERQSGVPTFRGQDGLWRNFRAEDLATPDAFSRDPRLVWGGVAAGLVVIALLALALDVPYLGSFIDWLINRTPVYGSLTALLAGIYASLVCARGVRWTRHQPAELGGGRRHPRHGHPVPAGPAPHPARS